MKLMFWKGEINGTRKRWKLPREVTQSFRTQYETSSLTVIVVRYYKDSLMKLRISDAIDCTCTAGGWSRELNPATRERRRGWGGWNGRWSMLSQSNTEEKDRTSEWMNGYQSVPSLCWSGSCRVCKSTPVSPLCPLSPDPLVTPANPAIAHTPHTWAQWAADFVSPPILPPRV